MKVSKRSFLRSGALALAAALCAALAACGGGIDAQTGAQGKVSIALTDAPSADFERVWITVKEVAFHKLDTAHPEDSAWLRFPLATPVTVDLAQLSDGKLVEVFSNLQLPVGDYRQIRLVLVDDDAPLTDSARAAGLQYNDQVDYVDAAGQMRSAPLELIGPRSGIVLFGRFSVVEGKTLRLAIDFDLDHDVLRFPDFIPGNGRSAFTLKPRLTYYDLDASGAIVGRVDPAALYGANNPGGAWGLVVKAEELAADGSRRVVTRLTKVRADGSFTLYPLPADSAIQKTYDVLIRGRNMQTAIVRNVPVTAGSTPTNNPTRLSSSPVPIVAGTEYTVDLAAAARPTGSWINFFQTLPGGGEVPYEVRFRHINPFDGLINVPFALSKGDLHVADYNGGGVLAFAARTPQQGAGGFTAFAGALQYERSPALSVTPPANGTSTSISVPPLSVDRNIAVPGAIRVDVATLTAGRYDKGTLVVARFGLIVDAKPLDAVLAANGGTLEMDNLPAGTTSNPLASAFYYAYARVWNSSNPFVRPRIVPAVGIADLRTSSSATVRLVLP
jgi:hypothetical protein